MNRYLKIILLVAFSLSVFACAPATVTKKEAFPKMYDQKPLSVIILPPINETTAADAKEYYSTTIAEPATIAGYYIYPIEVTSDILKSDGIYDTETILHVQPQKFREYFGADAVLYIKLIKWDTSYYVIGGNVTVAAEFLLKSTATGEEIWKYAGTVVVDTSAGNTGGGLAGLLVKAAITAIKTATTDYVPVAKKVNYLTMSSMPLGKYHPLHMQDKDFKVFKDGAVLNIK